MIATERVIELQTLAAGLGPVVKDLMAPLFTRIADLERRLEAVTNGKDGNDGLPGAVGPQGPQGAAGAAGEIGPAGADGKDGKDGKDAIVDINAVVTLVMALMPPARDGQPGVPGVAGRDGAKGLDGKDGKDGADGKDGLGFDDIDVTFDEQRGHYLKFSRGDVVKEFPLYVPFDTGKPYEPGRVYPRAAALRKDGSLWIAQSQTGAQPGHDKTWCLSVKKGTDGKTGPPGPEGPRGPKGDQGPPGPARY